MDHEKLVMNKHVVLKLRMQQFANYTRCCPANNDESLLQLQARLEEISPILKEFQDNVINIPFSRLYEIKSFEDNFFYATTNAKIKIAEGQKKITPNEKLPTIELPEFAGSTLEWQKFEDTFVTLVHSNEALTSIEKFKYLSSCLNGEPKEVIKSFKITDFNYSAAWNLLKNKYGNKKLITQAHIKEIFELNFIDESRVSLTKFIDSFREHLHALECLGQPVNHWDAVIVFLVTNKLSCATRREWETFVEKIDEPKINDLVEFLYKRCLIMSTSK